MYVCVLFLFVEIWFLLFLFLDPEFKALRFYFSLLGAFSEAILD